MDELLNLLALTLDPNLWTEQSTPLTQEIRKQMNDTLISYGTALEYFR
jgi:hypothetical protein